MNETPNSTNNEPGTTQPPASSPPQQSAAPTRDAAAGALSGAAARLGFRGNPLAVAVAVLALLLAAQWWSSRSQIRNLRAEVANRLQT
ncbi:MAG TPA: hypothetical protein VEC06_16580, partial [Paucimonas sp.]|nr:hypothetical protein [Paucimonas sp.]